MPAKTGIKPLLLEMNAGGNPFVAHASLLWDEHNCILVDAGLPGQLQVIRDALAAASIPFEKLTKVIITHQDMDHIGGLPELLSAGENRLDVLAHELAKPYLLGEIPLVKSGRIFPSTQVDVTLKDGDVLPFAGGVQVIFTPGHSPDHVSLYHIESKTLISGDALTSRDGVLLGPEPKFTPDMETALESLRKLLNFDIETVITYHGGVCTDRIKERLSAIVNGET
ncbi:MBL fold metallo-hydrolase [Paenibacillus sp. SI8]|uniref:MBL fold metallo-hydrolase n=1 Tax=unclassified Paenibacillus TaxID=185978 RepID=UPI003465FD67